MLRPPLPWLIGVQVWRTEVRGIRGKESTWNPPKIMTTMSILRREISVMSFDVYPKINEAVSQEDTSRKEHI